MTIRSLATTAFAYPFRAFFLVTAAYALKLIAAWVLFLFAAWQLPFGWAPMQWHTHEMIYGFVTAAIAGFLLTAITNWTGAPPLRGYKLLLLVLLWCAGRVVMWTASWLPGWLVALVDLLFLPVLTIYVSLVLLRYNNRRNLILVGVLLFLAIGNLVMHIGLVTGKTAYLQKGQMLGLDLIALLIAIIAGRITPAFTANWLNRNGRDPGVIKRAKWLEFNALGSVIALAIASLLSLNPVIVAALALLAALCNGLRLVLWRGWLTVREPLLWILHLAYLWLVLAFLFRGLGGFFDVFTPSLWQHTLGVGVIATLILGVMTRVSVGHTGRPLQLQRFGIFIYIAIQFAAVVRVLVVPGLLDFRLGIVLAGAAWMLAFAFFLIIYAPVLLSPRVDGKPG